MSIRTKKVINKTFTDSEAADLFFSERNSFGKTYQFIYQVETEPENVYYIDETVDNPILLTGGAVYSVNDKTGVVVLSTSDISEATNKKYVTDAQLTIIGNTSGTNTGDNATNSQYSGLAASKQDTLVSGTNIKTINSNSLLGSGDLVITAGDGNDDFTLVASFKSLYNY